MYMRSFSSTASELGPRGVTPPTRVAVAPSPSNVGGAYGIERRSRGVSSRATIGGGEADDGVTLALGIGLGIGVGEGATEASHATRAAARTRPIRRMRLSLTIAMAGARMSSPSRSYELVSLSQPDARTDDRNRPAFGERVVDPSDREIAYRTRKGIAQEPAYLGDRRAVSSADSPA